MLTTPPQPRLTGGSERPTPRCGNYRDVIDALDTKYPHPEHVEAVAHMCAACPIRERCWADQDGEQWLTHVKRGRRDSLRHRPLHGGWEARRQARVAELEGSIALGLGAEQTARRIGTTPKALREWCRRHGHSDLWNALEAA